MSEQDQDLLRAWTSGDSQAGNRLFRRHFASVYMFFANKVDAAVAEDLTQKTFLAITERAGVGAPRSFRAYLLGTARNLLFMHLRTQRRWSNRFVLAEVSAEDLGGSPCRNAAAKEEELLLLRALRRLPLELQMIVELHYWHGLRSAEMAEVLEIPHGTVKGRLQRARNKLRQEITAVNGTASVGTASLAFIEQWARSAHSTLAFVRRGPALDGAIQHGM